MKKLLCLVIPATLLCAACSSTEPAAAPTTTSRYAISKEEYLVKVHAMGGASDDETMVSLAKNICQMIETQGVDPALKRYEALLSATSIPSHDGATVVTYGVAAYCPEHFEAVATWATKGNQ